MKYEINGDIAGKEYWNNNWKIAKIPQIIDPQITSKRYYVQQSLNVLFHKIYSEYLPETRNKQFLEVGCGNSAILPYMHKEYGFNVTGLDYSDIGCEMAKRTATHYGVEADIILCDVFAPNNNLRKKFDVVYAGGVIEHFNETYKPCKAMSDLTKKGGLIINLIPNFSHGSTMGKMQKKYDPHIYSKHMPLNKDDMIKAHEMAGAKTLFCDYVLAFNYEVINFGGKHDLIRKCYVAKGIIKTMFKKDKITASQKNASQIIYIGRV